MRKLLAFLFLYTCCSSLLLAQTFTLKQLNVTNGNDRQVNIGDLDNNSYPDLFFSNINPASSEFYVNWRDTLIQATTGLGNAPDRVRSASIGDFDNDCLADIFFGNGGGGFNGSARANQLFQNAPYGSFTAVSGPGSLSQNTNSVAWGDHNKDGFLDMFIVNTSSQNNNLYTSNGNGTYTGLSGQSVVQDGDNGSSGQWVDFDNDDDLDLFVTNASDEDNLLYVQDSIGYFSKVTTGAIVNDGGTSFSGAWGDYNNDGHIDLFVANSANQVNFLYTNNGNGTFNKVSSQDIVTRNSYSTGASWGDLNNDGYIDLVIANGRTLPGSVNENLVYINNGNGTFSRMTSGSIVSDQQSSTSVAISDLDRDGNLDVILSSRNQANDIYFSQGGTNSYLSFDLYGTTSNSSALGAKIKLKADLDSSGNSTWQYRELMSNSGNGQNGFDIHFGIKKAAVIDSLVINWPSGQQCVFTNVTPNAYYHITEGICSMDTVIESRFTDTSSYLNAFFTDKSRGPLVRHFWDFGDASINSDTSNLPNPNYRYNQPGTYTVCHYIYDNVCKWDSSCTVVNICPDTSVLGFNDVALGLTLSVTDTSVSNAFITSWDFGDNTPPVNGNSVNHTYSSAGTYTVCLTLTDSCRTKSFCRTITVCNDTLLAGFGSSLNGLTVLFSDSSINATSISWNFGDGNTSNLTNPQHTFPAPGYYFVCQTVTDACTSSTFCDTVEVCLDTAVANFSVSSSGALFNFTSLSLNADRYNWDFGDGNFSSNPNPSHIFSNEGKFTVCLAVSNDCYSDTICQEVTVCANRGVSDYTFAKSSLPRSVQFNENVTNAISYSWDFGDGSSSNNPNPIKIFADPLVYKVCLTVTDSCGLQDSTCKNVDMTEVGLSELKILAGFQVYPNPTHGLVRLETNEIADKNLAVELIDLNGKKVLRSVYPKRERSMELDMSFLPDGIYILRIRLDGYPRNIRISKQ